MPELMVSSAGKVRVYPFPAFPVIANRAGENAAPRGIMLPVKDLPPVVSRVTVPDKPPPPTMLPKSRS